MTEPATVTVTPTAPKHVGVIGGGIAGLTAALRVFLAGARPSDDMTIVAATGTVAAPSLPLS